MRGHLEAMILEGTKQLHHDTILILKCISPKGSNCVSLLMFSPTSS